MRTDDKQESEMAVARALNAAGILNTRTLKAVAEVDSNRVSKIIKAAQQEILPDPGALAARTRAVIAEAGSLNDVGEIPPRLDQLLREIRVAIEKEAAAERRMADDRARASEQRLIAQHESEREALEAEIVQLHEHVGELEAVLAEERSAAAERARELEDAEAELAAANEERRRHAATCDAERASLRDEVRAARVAAEAAENAARQNQIALEREQAAHAAALRTLDDLRGRHENLTARIEELSGARARAEQERDQSRAEAEALRARLKAELAVDAEMGDASRTRARPTKGSGTGRKTKNATPTSQTG